MIKALDAPCGAFRGHELACGIQVIYRYRLASVPELFDFQFQLANFESVVVLPCCESTAVQVQPVEVIAQLPDNFGRWQHERA